MLANVSNIYSSKFVFFTQANKAKNGIVLDDTFIILIHAVVHEEF